MPQPAASPDPEDELRADIAGFAQDPLGFVYYAFPWGEPGTELANEQGPRAWQRDELEEITAKLLAGDIDGAIRIAVASGHGIGKSALVAWIILWALATAALTKVVITANTGDQLRTKTWPEVAKWFNLLICRHWFIFEATSIRARGKQSKTWRCDAATWSETNTAAFAGLHNKGRRIVLIFDEASQIADKVWEVAEGALTDEDTEIIWLVFGNPTETTGRFRECFAGGRFAHRWHPRQIDSRDVPGTNKTEIAKWIADWGEDSDFVRVRVKGQFPRGGSMQFIDGDTVQAATRREAVSHLRQPLILGVDVARFGDDQQVVYSRRGLDARTIPPLKFRGLDLVSFSGKIVEHAQKHGAAAVFIDEGGMGAGVVDMVRSMLPGVVVIGVNFGGKPDGMAIVGDQVTVADKAAEMWAHVRIWLKRGAIPNDPEIVAELTARQYGFDTHSAIRLESKADMKKRGLTSPDNADALALTFAYPVADLPEAAMAGPHDYAANARGFGVSNHQSDYDPYADLDG
jgi:hypothetical protein